MTVQKIFLLLLAAVWLAPAMPVRAQSAGYLAGVKKHRLITSTVPVNGDQNPYAMLVAR